MNNVKSDFGVHIENSYEEVKPDSLEVRIATNKLLQIINNFSHKFANKDFNFPNGKFFTSWDWLYGDGFIISATKTAYTKSRASILKYIHF